MRCPSVTDPQLISSSYARFLHDESSLRAALPRRILFPTSARELSSAVRELADHREPATISGARTGIVGGAVASGGETLVSMEKLVAAPRVGFSERFNAWTVKAGPGVTLDALRTHLAEASGSRSFPVDPTEGGASLGGMVATNASGARTLLYGPTRAWVASLTAVLANGEVVELFRGDVPARNGEISIGGHTLRLPSVRIPPTKHAVAYHTASGMEGIDLFIGGEGTLAVIASVELFLTERPRAVCGVAAFLRHGEPVETLVADLKGDETIHPRALEYMDSHSISILDGLRKEVGPRSTLPALPSDAAGLLYAECASGSEEEAERRLLRLGEVLAAHGVSPQRTWAATTPRELEEIRVMRHTLPERINALILQRREALPDLTKLAADCAVPDGKLGEMLRAYRDVLGEAALQHAVFGHIGNAHLHANILPRTRDELARAKAAFVELARMAVSLGGSVSGEHGIGKLKKELLGIQYSPQELEGLRSVKTQLDPHGILNP
ncbi:MAG TPA: FAD-binding oxidoreductase, partial [Spirochaetia bacterium]|nr:FAD-binding oxidoreductase [Spirochaetia bacterium]